jgi:hypothetical protein
MLMGTMSRFGIKSISAFHRLGRIAGLSLVAWSAMPIESTAALTVTSMSPIVITDCRISNTRSYVSGYRPLVLAFSNRRAVPADEVRFTVEYAGRTERIVDRGTFSQNVRIDHAFDGFYNVRYRGPSANCSVDYVEFQDGSVWTAASASPAPRCPQSG